jgi:putrescine transport system substrate-binding protein
VTYDTFDSNDTLETKLLAGKSGYDVVVPSANFLQQQIKAGVFQKLDKSKLPNLANAWPEVTKRLAVYDPGNQYAVNYMWGTVGIGYNVKKAREALGADGKIDSWDIVFKPENLSKFKACGVHILDSADDILPAALKYLGFDPNSSKQDELEKAAALVGKIRPNVRKFHSSEYLNALASGEICLVVGFSGDIKQAQNRAAEAKRGGRDRLCHSQGGRAALVRQPRHPEGRQARRRGACLHRLHAEAGGGGEEFQLHRLCQRQSGEPAVPGQGGAGRPGVYPDAEAMAKLYTTCAHDAQTSACMNRLWTRIKTDGESTFLSATASAGAARAIARDARGPILR